MSGAEAMVALLKREGVEVVFGLPGVQIMAAIDAIYREGSIRWISTRHEQTAAYMAYGYARTTGKIGVAMVLPGPGALNTAAAIGTAYTASAPVLLISGQIESYHLGFHRGVLHELDEQIDIFRHLTKWCGRATKAEEIPQITAQALRELKSGRPRPVEIEVPFDLWTVEADMSLPPTTSEAPAQPAPGDIKQAAAILGSARRPLILAGGGAAKSEVSAEITQLAERLNAPIVMTTEGQGVIPADHPLSAGNFIFFLNPALKEADVVLIVGSRLRSAGNQKLDLRPDQKVIQIDFEIEEIGRNHRIDLGITADAHNTLCALVEALPSATASRWHEKDIIAIREKSRAMLEKAAPVQMEILRSIRAVMPDDGIIVPDITNLGYWSDIAFPVNRPRGNVDSSYFATLGFAFPTALGAKVGNPERPVVVLCGDGGFPYAAMELAIAVQEGINVVVLVFTDAAYGTVTGIQRREYGGRFVGNRLHNPDFARFAETFGAAGIKLSHYRELGEKLGPALAADRPTVIEVPVPQLEPPWNVLF
ncbi:MAG: thiamine pyrophosphate-binding protein [Chloroflexota bacterium]